MAIAHVQAPAGKFPRADAFDTVTESDLRASGSLKWSAFPEELPAWVAEMDFGLAGPIAVRLHESVANAQVGYLPVHLVNAMGQACRDFLATRHGWDVPAEWIRPVADVLSALEATVEHFTPTHGAHGCPDTGVHALHHAPGHVRAQTCPGPHDPHRSVLGTRL